MASVYFDNGSATDLYWYFRLPAHIAPGNTTGLVKGYNQVPATIPNNTADCGWLVKTSFTGIVFVNIAASPPYALQIYARADAAINDPPGGTTGTSVTWHNKSGGPLTWIVKSGTSWVGASLAPLSVNPRSGPPMSWNPRVRWGWRVANFTGRLLFTLDGFTLTADNQTS